MLPFTFQIVSVILNKKKDSWHKMKKKFDKTIMEYFQENYPDTYEIIRGATPVIMKEMELVDFQQNQHLLIKHQIIDPIYLIYDGVVSISNEFPDGKVYKFTKNYATDFIGSHAILANHKEAAVTVTADTNVKSIAIPTKVFLKWIKSDANSCFFVAQQIANHMYPISFDYGKHLFSSTFFIFVDYLLREIDELPRDHTYIVKKTREQLSDQSGISIRSINRNITKLKELDFIKIKKGKITISADVLPKLRKLLHESNL